MSWGWALDVLYLAMKYLNFSNKWLLYGNETIMPFYLLHQPVIVTVSYFVVQWDAGILVKLLVVLISSFFITLGLVELLIRPFKPIRSPLWHEAQTTQRGRSQNGPPLNLLCCAGQLKIVMAREEMARCNASN